MWYPVGWEQGGTLACGTSLWALGSHLYVCCGNPLNPGSTHTQVPYSLVFVHVLCAHLSLPSLKRNELPPRDLSSVSHKSELLPLLPLGLSHTGGLQLTCPWCIQLCSQQHWDQQPLGVPTPRSWRAGLGCQLAGALTQALPEFSPGREHRPHAWVR